MNLSHPEGRQLLCVLVLQPDYLGWFFVSIMRALAVSAKNQEETTITSISTDDVETTQEDQSAEA